MHIPVLEKEVLRYLDPRPNENFIDCTFGSGGHAFAILEKISPKGKLLGIEWDKELIHQVKIKIQELKFKNNLILVCDSFVNLKKIVEKIKFKAVKGILFDLGFSSWHLEKSGRGFSFLRDEPLDMRYHIRRLKESPKLTDELTAEKILNEWSRKEIEKILKEYGEERFTKRIVQEIIKERKIRPIKTTFQLVEIVKRATPFWYLRRRIHPATKTFQALRIVVNDELNNLKNVLPQALEVLEKKGRLVIISFHSLEDRIVKNFFRENARINQLKILTKKPVRPSEKEIKNNPRSRSAKLRAIMKI